MSETWMDRSEPEKFTEVTKTLNGYVDDRKGGHLLSWEEEIRDVLFRQDINTDDASVENFLGELIGQVMIELGETVFRETSVRRLSEQIRQGVNELLFGLEEWELVDFYGRTLRTDDFSQE